MAFHEQMSGGVVWMTSDLLPVKHAFTTRLGGVSTGALSSLNLGEHRGDDRENVMENYRRLGEALSIDPSSMVFTKQVHGTNVPIVTRADARGPFGPVRYEADGLVTGERSLPLTAFTADCIPVLLCDPDKGVAAAVHCGWRGSVADILGVAVARMRELGAQPRDIRAAIGPGIGFCCFETGAEVPEAMKRWLGGDAEGLYFQKDGGKFMADLQWANHRRLLQLGLRTENIDVSDECTVCNCDKYWSHRASGGDRGAQAAIIVL